MSLFSFQAGRKHYAGHARLRIATAIRDSSFLKPHSFFWAFLLSLGLVCLPSLNLFSQDFSKPAPMVSAGDDQLLFLGQGATSVNTLLDGTVTARENGITSDFTPAWSLVSGPGKVIFDNSQALDTKAQFSGLGQYTLQLTVSDGKVKVSDTLQIKVESLNQSPSININFQPENVPVPAGYLADSGKMFCSQNGLYYGWNINHADAVRDRNANPDQLLDTICLIHTNGIWEIQLANGDYEVTASIGDSSFASTYTLNVESVNYWTAVDLAKNQFLKKTQTVKVNDGRLTVDAGKATNMLTRINYLIIQFKSEVDNTAS